MEQPRPRSRGARATVGAARGALASVALLLASCGDDEARPVDAAAVDAAADATIDATADAAIDAAAACAGTRVGGHCWYKGALGESCTTLCASRGGVSAATIAFAGAASAGDRSNQASCQAVAAALSTRPFRADIDNVNESNDYGCVEEPDKNRSELVSLAATVTTSAHVMLARFCACVE